MQTLPKEYVLLKRIGGYINELLDTSITKEIARLSDIYDYIKNKDDFRKEFTTPVEFSRFMRKMHNKNVLKQFIKNCSVNTTIPHRYQWRFYPQDRIMKKETTPEDPNIADSHPDTSNFIPWTKIHLAANR